MGVNDTVTLEDVQATGPPSSGDSAALPAMTESLRRGALCP
jgi:hypothetical protein